MNLSPLQPGDIVDVVAPASRCSDLELRNGVRALIHLGLRPRVPKNLFGSKSIRLFSNTDEQRLKQLQRALIARDSKMIWCLRGGYGSLRLLPQLQRMRRPKAAKIFLGYSDITTLHLFLNQEWGWTTLHGQMLERFGGQKMKVRERRHLLSVLFGSRPQVDYGPLLPLNASARISRRIKSTVLGGNLAVLQSSLGTPSQFDPPKSILFFEDIGERPHRVDRMLEQMTQSGVLKNAKAILFGYFMLDNFQDRRDLWNDVIPRFAARQKIPVLKGLKVGHNWQSQSPLPFNTPAELSLGRNPRLVVATGIGHR